MLITGIIGQDKKMKTANLINSILSLTGKRISIIDSKEIMEFNSNLLKNYILELKKHKIDILIIKIDILDFENDIFINLKFDIIIYDYRSDYSIISVRDKCIKLIQKSIAFLDKNGIIIIDVEDNELLYLLNDDVKQHIITYGFNSKASMTTSSIGDTLLMKDFMCYLQKTILTKNGKKIEPQEYLIRIESNEVNPYNILAAATFAIINGVDLNMVNNI